jgi:hypothetical protein
MTKGIKNHVFALTVCTRCRIAEMPNMAAKMAAAATEGSY